MGEITRDDASLYIVKYWDNKVLKHNKVYVCASSIAIAIELVRKYTDDDIIVESAKLVDDTILVQR